jgi:hypothetical protein
MNPESISAEILVSQQMTGNGHIKLCPLVKPWITLIMSNCFPKEQMRILRKTDVNATLLFSFHHHQSELISFRSKYMGTAF